MSKPDLPFPITSDHIYLHAIVDGLQQVAGKLDQLLDRFPNQRQGASAAGGGPVEVREPDPPTLPVELDRAKRQPVREPAKKATKTTGRR